MTFTDPTIPPPLKQHGKGKTSKSCSDKKLVSIAVYKLGWPIPNWGAAYVSILPLFPESFRVGGVVLHNYVIRSRYGWAVISEGLVLVSN